jgi:hypothetical protein
MTSAADVGGSCGIGKYCVGYHLNNSGEAVGKIGASQIADLRVNYRRYV